MTGKMKRMAALIMTVGMLAGLCGCAANQTPDKSTKDVSEKEDEKKEMSRSLFCTTKDMYYVPEFENQIVQRSFAGDPIREYKLKNYVELISVEDDWIYYYSGDDVCRAPILHESESDRLDLGHTEKLLQGARNGSPWDVLVIDSGLLYQPEWKEEVWYYDFASKKKRRCMKDLLSNPDKFSSVEIVSAFGNYAVITVEFYDKKATFGSVYRTYRYDVKRDEAELIPESAALRMVVPQSLQFGENLIIETWEDGDEEPRLIQYNMEQNSMKTLLTREQFRKMFESEIQPGITKNQMDWATLQSIFSDDGKRVYVEYEVLWHKGTEYHMRNYVVSVSREDGSVRYEDEISEAMAKTVKPRKLLWTNNYDAKTDCLFFAHEVCIVEMCNGKILLHACSKEKGKGKVSYFCYDLKKDQLREISGKDNEIFYATLRDGEYSEEMWELDGCLGSWPNKMEYKEQ